MRKRWSELKGSDTSLGVFYPMNYIFAVFDSYESAQRAEQRLLAAGYGEDEVLALTGEYMIAEYEKVLKDANWLDRVQQKISQAVGCEVAYIREAIGLAKQGAGFLAVYSPTEREAQRTVRLVKPENPKTMRRYLRLAIEDLS
ncbi:MAG: hypothetical protein ACREVE_04680 [Gammaproteobacteria bacterium]